MGAPEKSPNSSRRSHSDKVCEQRELSLLKLMLFKSIFNGDGSNKKCQLKKYICVYYLSQMEANFPWVKFLRTVTKLKLKEKGKFVNYEFFKFSSMEHRIRSEVVPWMGVKEMYWTKKCAARAGGLSNDHIPDTFSVRHRTGTSRSHLSKIV